MANISYDQTTDTHLAKKYNDTLFMCMVNANTTGFAIRVDPHIDNLMAYHAAVETFLTNTFFLFETIQITIHDNITKKEKKEILSKVLMQLNNEIHADIKKMKQYPKFRTSLFFNDVQMKIGYMHKMIMYGLQRRHMLVRMSDREPKGEESIQYWNEKVGFKKGGLPSDIDLKGGDF